MASNSRKYEEFSGTVSGCAYCNTKGDGRSRVVIRLGRSTSPNQKYVLYGKRVPPVLVGHYVEGMSSPQGRGIRRVERMIIRGKKSGRSLAHYLDELAD